jgi:hypothetical protein
VRHRYLRGDHSGALLLYMRAAAMGIEVAQLNAAWLLSRFVTHIRQQQHASPLALGATNTRGFLTAHRRSGVSRARSGRVRVSDAPWLLPPRSDAAAEGREPPTGAALDHDGAAAAAEAEAAVRMRTLRLWAAAVQQVNISLHCVKPLPHP